MAKRTGHSAVFEAAVARQLFKLLERCCGGGIEVITVRHSR
jgi:hypothetical protein